MIRDGASGGIVYMPPEAKDVPELMAEMVDWINDEIHTGELPAPVVAALAHYQFATIHPYNDGNGRTARLLTTSVLHRCGYGLKGIYSLEEYYASNLGSYYEALATGTSHNYYLGRAEADVSGFVSYFCQGMAVAFGKVRARAEAVATLSDNDASRVMRDLDALQKQVVGLFSKSRVVTSSEVSNYLGIPVRRTRGLCARWVGEGFLEIEDPAKRSRSYRLAKRYEVGL